MSTNESSDGWTVVDAMKLPGSARAHGFVDSTDFQAHLKEALIPVSLERMGQWGIVAVRCTGKDPIVVVELNIAAEASGGRVENVEWLQATDRVLDARAGEAWLAWQHEGNRVRLRLLPGGDLLMEIARGTQSLDWLPPPPLELATADVTAELSSWRSPTWLRDEVDAAAKGTVLQRATARALIARFAIASIEELIDGVSPWVGALREWSDRSTPLRTSILEQGAIAADSLSHQLDALQESVSDRREGASARLHAWLLDRDDLHSLALLGEKARENSPAWDGFIAALQLLDAEAKESLDLFADFRVKDTRLAELSWRDPGAWWGQL